MRLPVLWTRPGCCWRPVIVGCAHPHLREMNSNRCGSERRAGTARSGATCRGQQRPSACLAGLWRRGRSRGRLCCRHRAGLCRWHCRLGRRRCTAQQWGGRVARPTRGLAAGPSSLVRLPHGRAKDEHSAGVRSGAATDSIVPLRRKISVRLRP